MRKFKLLALLLAVLMVMAAMTGCVTKKDLDTRVTALEAKADAQATTLADLTANLKQVGDAVKANKGDIEALLNEKIGDVQKAIADLTTVVNGKASAEELTEKANSLTAAINSVKEELNGKIVDNVETLSALGTKMGIVEAKLKGIDGEVLAEINDAMDELTTAYAAAISAAVEKLKTENIQALKSETMTLINDLQSRATALEEGKADKIDVQDLSNRLGELQTKVNKDVQDLENKLQADKDRGVAQVKAIETLNQYKAEVKADKRYTDEDRDALVELIDTNKELIHFALDAEAVGKLVAEVEDKLKELLPVDEAFYKFYASLFENGKVFDERETNKAANGKSYRAIAMEAMLYLKNVVLDVPKYGEGKNILTAKIVYPDTADLDEKVEAAVADYSKIGDAIAALDALELNTTTITGAANDAAGKEALQAIVAAYKAEIGQKDLAPIVRAAFFRLWYNPNYTTDYVVDKTVDGIKLTQKMVDLYTEFQADLTPYYVGSDPKDTDDSSPNAYILNCFYIKKEATAIQTILDDLADLPQIKFADFATIQAVKIRYNVFDTKTNGDEDPTKLIDGWLYDAKFLAESNTDRVSAKAVSDLADLVAIVENLNSASSALKTLGTTVEGNNAAPVSAVNKELNNLFWQYETMDKIANVDESGKTMADFYYDKTGNADTPSKWIENVVKYERIQKAIDDWRVKYNLDSILDVQEVMKNTVIGDATDNVWVTYVGSESDSAVDAEKNIISKAAATSFYGRYLKMTGIKATLGQGKVFDGLVARIEALNELKNATPDDINKYNAVNAELDNWRKLAKFDKTNFPFLNIDQYNFYDLTKKYELNADSYKTNVIAVGNFAKGSSGDDVWKAKDQSDYFYLYDFDDPEISAFFETVYKKAENVRKMLLKAIENAKCLEDLVYIKGEYVAPAVAGSTDATSYIQCTLPTMPVDHGVMIYNKVNYVDALPVDDDDDVLDDVTAFGLYTGATTASKYTVFVKPDWEAIPSVSDLTGATMKYEQFAPLTIEAFKAAGVVDGKFDLYTAMIVNAVGGKSVLQEFNTKWTTYTNEIAATKAAAKTLLDTMGNKSVYLLKDTGNTLTYFKAETLSYDLHQKEIADAYACYEQWIKDGYNPLLHEQVQQGDPLTANKCFFRPIFSEYSTTQLGAYVARMEQLKHNIDILKTLLTAIKNTTYKFEDTVLGSAKNEIALKIANDKLETEAGYIKNFFGNNNNTVVASAAGKVDMSLEVALEYASSWYKALLEKNTEKTSATKYTGADLKATDIKEVKDLYLAMMKAVEFYYAKCTAYKMVNDITYTDDAKTNWNEYYKDNQEVQNETAFNVLKNSVLLAIKNAKETDNLIIDVNSNGYEFIADRMNYFNEIVDVLVTDITFDEVLSNKTGSESIASGTAFDKVVIDIAKTAN